MNNKQIKNGCGIAGVVFMALAFLMKLLHVIDEFIQVGRNAYLSREYYMLPILGLFIFAGITVAFSFGVVSLVHNGKKSLVSEIILVVCFFANLSSHLDSISAFLVVIFMPIAIILYTIYFASVMMAKKPQNVEIEQMNKPMPSFDDRMNKLTVFKQMLDDGLISQEEFAERKRDLLEG